MKKVLIVLASLVLVGCAAGLAVTSQALGETQSMLRETRTSLSETQVKLQNTTQSLAETQHKLQNTTISLEETQHELRNTTISLEEQKSQTAKYIQLYESNLEELNNREKELKGKEAELKAVTGKLTASQQENEGLQEQLDEVERKLELYEDTLGVQVFSGIMPPYQSGDLSNITLSNNNTAMDPTWKQLEGFLLEDKTDKKLYVNEIYVCGNYAQDLHNNAEAKGIRTAFVVVHFNKELPHALNAFKTLDRALVYIDVTGASSPIRLANLDKKVQLEKGERYRSSLLFPNGWGLGRDTRLVKSIEIYW
jgi:myosin heavy subunit